MPPKLDDALPGDKLLNLYQRLTLDKKAHFQADIARDLGCSPQAVPRMISTIERHLGKDSYIEFGIENRRRYYRICSRDEDKSLSFLSDDLHSLALCCDIAALHLPEHVVDRMRRSFTAIALQMGDASNSSLPGASIGFNNKGHIDYSQHLNTIGSIRQAIANKTICQVLYRAAGRKAKGEYRYAPGRIMAMNGSLYVQGYRLVEASLLKDRPTTFSLHRIQKVTPTGEYFRFDAADHDARQFGLNWHEPKRVKIKIGPTAADYVRDRIWSDDQDIAESEDGSIVLTITTTSEREIKAWVGSFCGEAKTMDAEQDTNVPS
jgi:predicted DNA-binding transcriptional regulator YafY